MNKQKYPPGWDEARVQRVIDHYENISEDDLLAEDEAARKAGKSHLTVTQTVHEGNGTVIVKDARRKKKGKQPKAPRGSKRRNASGPNEKSKPVTWRTGSKVLPLVKLELESSQKKEKRPRVQPPPKQRLGANGRKS